MAAGVSDVVLPLHTSGAGVEVTTGFNTCFVATSFVLDSRAPSLSPMAPNYFSCSFSANWSGTDRLDVFSPSPRSSTMGSADAGSAGCRGSCGWLSLPLVLTSEISGVKDITCLILKNQKFSGELEKKN